MQTRSDIETELTNRLYIATNSELLSSARITTLVQDAHLWAGGRHFWPSLMRARLFTALKNTQSLNYDYYDYPVDFLTGSASRLYIDGVKYEKKAFQDFLDYCDNTQAAWPAPDPTKHYFAEYGRQFFTWPSYTGVAPALNGILWGNIQTPPLSSATTLTVFSLWDDSLNEAILQKALSVATGRIDSGFSNENLQLAIAALDQQWGKIVAEMQRSQRLNHPFFNVIDMFNQNAGQATIGNFAFANGGY